MTEAAYQAKLIKRLEKLFPGCIVLKNDPNYRQGMPDLLVLHQDCWAMLEVKGAERAVAQPNQAYYVKELGEMSFASFIYPENEEEVLLALQEAFASRGQACLS